LPKVDYKVFSNIPFNYSSRILKKLYFSNELSPIISYLILQKEVYEKYNGKNRETQLSLLLKPFYAFNFIESIPSAKFKPTPKVDIVFASVSKRSVSLIDTPILEEYQDFIVYSTSVWRKGNKNVFKNIFTYTQLKRLSKDLKFSLRANPLDLNFDQWLGLFNFYTSNTLPIKKSLVEGSYLNKIIKEERLKKRYKSVK